MNAPNAIARLKKAVSAAYNQVDTALFGAALQDLMKQGLSVDQIYRQALAGNGGLDRGTFNDLVALSKSRGHL